ncbi:beta-lactamase-like protein 2 homolog [Nymphalis io]|uniref:beta-lactamase-like protein 2 homolog n=1 Tax=Inachis io TaxID=171585 RepID=UPI00216A01EA|nr:beta-lactamase-like protein 2 homolog [Nymphalis io]XP_050362214.1 beta-lactamase-like protein 2 homolog [Nymphalis io]XP_050362215.1 beta-lactamase-like protein 2 homolog [Nymphalis io]XP_050362216.1 beta-lactamase-like protein 2 homolog [Nymphalis io]XP_050362217.1 beta-lactamase-like protein 2 homolog [Nymphalis io]
MAAVIPAVTKLSNRIIRILGCNPGPMTLQGTNTYLIGTGRNRILLDTGDRDVQDYQKNLAEVVKAEKINIEHIVVTHWHHDHIGGVENLYGTIAKEPQIWKHKKDPSDSPDNELPSTLPLNWLTDGQEIKVEGATVKIHHTPGHTTDHVVLTLLEENILFSGDCILGEGTAVFEDLFTYMKSLHKILKLKPNVIYPGHGNVIEDPLKKIEYYIEHRNQREEQILDVMKKNVETKFNEMDLVKVIYVETPEHLWSAAAYNVSHHLKKLTKENKITCFNTDGENKWQFTGSRSNL